MSFWTNFTLIITLIHYDDENKLIQDKPLVDALTNIANITVFIFEVVLRIVNMH